MYDVDMNIVYIQRYSYTYGKVILVWLQNIPTLRLWGLEQAMAVFTSSRESVFTSSYV